MCACMCGSYKHVTCMSTRGSLHACVSRRACEACFLQHVLQDSWPCQRRKVAFVLDLNTTKTEVAPAGHEGGVAEHAPGQRWPVFG